MATALHDRLQTSGDNGVVTACGRRIAVRCLRLTPTEPPISRVALDMGRDQGGEPGAWAALSAGEARGLARLLLQYADLAEGCAEPVRPAREDSSSA
ncbi:hypothetical protein ACIRJO_43840 [Streptomyces sp. NPDC102394]|uniref:hypothetical protein n=1 Tax=Streptomyces sp. NPDC102394 TaxID=3366167 RepID=UPI0038209143